MSRCSIAIVLAWTTVAFAMAGRADAQVPAFPGAEGFGAYTVGGRGGAVYEVTTLNDGGPGSLRAACEAAGPRIVVFRVSGTIALQSPLIVTNPYITLAGQTAPGDGICLKNWALRIQTDQVIVRHMRFRPGNDAPPIPPDYDTPKPDSISIDSGINIIVDHCSASWSLDETLSAALQEDTDQLRNVTVQWCIISESLDEGIPGRTHGFASLIKSHSHTDDGISFHHNLFAHHTSRAPRPGGYLDLAIDPLGLLLDFRNNVIYNCGHEWAGYNDNDGTYYVRLNYVGNYLRAGPYNSGYCPGGCWAYKTQCVTEKAYFADNWFYGYYPTDPYRLVRFEGFSSGQIADYKVPTPYPTGVVTTDDAESAYVKILGNAGATRPARDPVDRRIVNDVVYRTGNIIDDEAEVGGWPVLSSAAPPLDTDHDGMPDDWESARGLSATDPTDGPLDPDGDGYTNLEDYLNVLALGGAVNPSPPDGARFVDLDTKLRWSPVIGATSYDVYVGATSPGAFRGSRTEPVFDPGMLDPGQTYYWRIDTVYDETAVPGEVWSFTTTTDAILTDRIRELYDWDVVNRGSPTEAGFFLAEQVGGQFDHDTSTETPSQDTSSVFIRTSVAGEKIKWRLVGAPLVGSGGMTTYLVVRPGEGLRAGPDGMTHNYTLLEFRGGGQRIYITGHASGDTTIIRAHDRAGGSEIGSGFAVPTGQWAHLWMAYDDTSQRFEMYDLSGPCPVRRLQGGVGRETGTQFTIGDESSGDVKNTDILVDEVYLKLGTPLNLLELAHDNDADGELSGCDNCPNDYNPGQADADADGVGDACDSCPGTPAGTPVGSDGCPPTAPADFDADGDVDLVDYGAFLGCYNGPGRPPAAAGCDATDFNADGDVDLSDYGEFLDCYNGSDNPPACG